MPYQRPESILGHQGGDMRDWVLWASSLATGPKIILSVVVFLIAAFILIVLWAPAPAPNAAPIEKSPTIEPADRDSPAPSTPTATHSDARPSTSRGQAPTPAPQSASPSVSAGRVEGSVIISQGQVGGQVAHSITNVGPQPRKASAQAFQMLVQSLKAWPPSNFEIEVVNGDAEANALGHQLSQALQNSGWHLTTFAASIFPMPITGLTISATENTGPVNVLLAWCQAAGFAPKFSKVQIDKVHVLVGSRE